VLQSPAPHLTHWPRGLSRVQAAAYVGLGVTFFDKQVSAGVFPDSVKIGSRKLWDIRQLDGALDSLFAGPSIQSEEIELR
jgi:predicted DNA-binding transcriptional regulator AlpA